MRFLLCVAVVFVSATARTPFRGSEGGSGFRTFVGSIKDNEPDLTACERRFNESGFWVEKQFAPEANNLTMDDPDFFLHTLFLTSVKTTYLQSLATTFQNCAKGYKDNRGTERRATAQRSTTTVFCDPNQKVNVCPSGAECAPNGVLLWNRGVEGFRGSLAVKVDPPSSLANFKTISYCRPIQMDAQQDADSFEESSWPLIRDVVGEPTDDLEKYEIPMKSNNFAARGGTPDLGFRQLQWAFTSQEKSLMSEKVKGSALRRKRSFWKKLGKAFKRFLGVALASVTGFIRFRGFTLNING